jgi:glycosyltransferase involved in cell wall biosynthesis
MTRVFYITRANLSLKRAHSHNALKTIQALGERSDIDLTLILGKGFSKNPKEVFAEHSITSPSFRIVILKSKSYLSFMGFLWRSWRDFNVIYTRDHTLWLVLLTTKLFGKKFFFEVHRLARKWYEPPRWWFLTTYASGLAVIADALRLCYQRRNSNIAVAHCGAPEPELFNYSISKEGYRKKLNLPLDKFLMCAMGNIVLYNLDPLYDGLAKSDPRIQLVLLGIKKDEVPDLEKKLELKGIKDRVIIVLRVPYRDTPQYLLASDVLLVPEARYGPGDTSTKIYEYFAAGRPIISYTTESNVEVLHHERNALMVLPPTPENWKSAFERLLNDPIFLDRLGRACLEDVSKYSWQKRAEAIAGVIKRGADA